MHADTPDHPPERIALALLWIAASLTLLAWALLGARTLRAVLPIGQQETLGLLALVVAVSLAGMALGAALMARWRHARRLALVLTWPLTAFAAWSAAWSALALLASPGGAAAVALAVPLLTLYLLHRTRRVAHALATPRPTQPTA
jgi:hypothetical protein